MELHLTLDDMYFIFFKLWRKGQRNEHPVPYNYRYISLLNEGLRLCSQCYYFYFLAPSRAPDLVTAYNSSSTGLVIKWSHLLNKHFQGEPLGYHIAYYPADAEGERISVSVNNTTNATMLSNLSVYTMYVANVSAVSSGGIGPANTAKARTGAGGNVISSIKFPL